MSITDISKQLASDTVQALGPVGAVMVALFLLLYVGVVLPTVWSRHAYRRTAARRTMTTLLDYLDRLTLVLRFWQRR
ncbi:hypothetical protein ACIRL0_11935 [Streptomyces sp. NPDC102365]|uniref:hypothetical protein n=1 Tax=Streptomyces sp. NPDC102365 TaxID=3366162 RepID=UPI0038134972